MKRQRTSRILAAVAAIVIIAIGLVGAGGCSEKIPEITAREGGAIAGVTVARSALSTMAPDAKLLVVQTAQTVTATSTPVWAYLFGSPAKDLTYAVTVVDGRVASAAQAGTGGLSKDQWAEVPDTTTWEIDADIAVAKAMEAGGATGTPAAYFMGFQTYVPPTIAENNGIQAFKWYVSFRPDTSGATTSTILVDAKTGTASVR